MQITKLNELERNNIIYGKDHPIYPNLRQYNYQVETQFSKSWNSDIIQCRGLIFDTKLNKVVARPFSKFFNYSELTGLDWTNLYDMPQSILTSDFICQEKMDGSLIICYYYEGWNTATRGSFTSTQAIAAKNLLDKYGQLCLNPDYTYLFEYVGPENRIVVPYTTEDIILLGIIHTESAYELTEEEITALNLPYNRPIIYRSISSLVSAELKKEEDGTCFFEGFVLKFRNGSKVFRVKLKASTYCALHRIMSNFTPKRVFESLRDNIKIDLESVPDEFYDEYTKIQEEILYQYKILEASVLYDYIGIIGKVEIYNIDQLGLGDINRKRFAEYAKQTKHPSILFSLLDGKPYNHIIWKILENNYELCNWNCWHF